MSDYQYESVESLDGEVEKIVDWGKENDVKIMLCIYNVRSGGVNWGVAKKAYHENPSKTIESLMSIVNKFDLDGIDIDFESGGSVINNVEQKGSFLWILCILW